MKRIYQKLCIAILLLLLIVSEGRQLMVTSREISDLELVTTLGIDKGEGDPQAVMVTALGSGEGTSSPLFLREEDLTVNQAITKLRASADKHVFFDHVEQIILGEDAVLDQLAEQLDFAARDISLRLNAAIYVVKGSTATSLMEMTQNKNSIIFDYLRTVEQDMEIFPTSYPFTVSDVLQQLLMTDGCALVPALVLDDESTVSPDEDLTANTSEEYVTEDGTGNDPEDMLNPQRDDEAPSGGKIESQDSQDQKAADSGKAQSGGSSQEAEGGSSSGGEKAPTGEGSSSSGGENAQSGEGEGQSGGENAQSSQGEGQSGGGGAQSSGDSAQSGGGQSAQSSGEQSTKTALLDGYAVFKNYKLVDYIGASEARGVNLLFNKLRNDALVVSGPDGGYVGLKVTHGSAKVQPEFEGDVLRRLRIEMQFSADINEIRGEENEINDELLTQLEDALCRREISFVIKAIQKSQELEADFLALGAHVECNAPGKWYQIKDQWQDIFPTLEIVVTAEARVNRTYDIAGPIGGKA